MLITDDRTDISVCLSEKQDKMLNWTIFHDECMLNVSTCSKI